MSAPASDARSQRVRWPIVLAVGLAAGLALMAALAASNALQPHTFSGTVLQGAEPAPDFDLETAAGQRVRLAELSGKLVVLFFGYTFCPDVCPTTLHDLDQTMDLLGPQADQVQVIFVSVDPQRDTPDEVADYASRFNPSFLGTTGSPEVVDRVATLYGIYYAAHEGTEATGYLVDHTASVMVIDRAGHLRLIFPWGTSPEDIAADLAYLLR